MNESADSVLEPRAKVNGLPSASYLNECFQCDPDTGILVWRERPMEHFVNEGRQKIWNTRYAGKEAGSGWHKKGYRLVQITGFARYYCHRVVWTLFNGPIPDGLGIDHINGITSDNRLVNLRLATHQQNMLNSKRREGKNIFRGLPAGVAPSLDKWMARITVDGHQRYLGRFDTIEAAAAAYQEAHLARAGAFAREDQAIE